MYEINYENKGASCSIELPSEFSIPFYGSIMDIEIVHSSKHGVAFVSNIRKTKVKPKRHFVSSETFVMSYGKYKMD